MAFEALKAYSSHEKPEIKTANNVTPADWSGNIQSVYGSLGARNLATADREEHDFYATSPEATEWLLQLEQLRPSIWEPSCGQGHISKVLEAAGYNVLSTDLVDRGYGTGGINFFTQTSEYNGDIVTNPPYKFATEYVYKALSLIPEGHKVCLFLKLQFLEGRERKKLFLEHPPIRIWVSSSRIACSKNGDFDNNNNGLIAYAWFVWEKGFKGDTIVKWLN